MKNERKTEIKVGITVLVGILIFLWILGWAKNISVKSNETNIKVNFSNVSGLEIGDPVTVNGMRKGYVKDMIISPEFVTAELSIDNDVQLKKDATFALTMLDLMGGKKIDIFPGISEEKFDYSRTSSGKFYADIPSVMSLLGSVQDDFVTVLKDVKVSLNSLNKYLTDDKFSSEVRTSISNLSSLTNKLNIILSENRDDIKTLTSNAVSLTEKSNELLSNNKQNINQLFEDLKSISEKSNNLLTQINDLTRETVNQQNNVGKLLYDENLIKDIKQTIKQVNELTGILIEQLKGDGINVDANIF